MLRPDYPMLFHYHKFTHGVDRKGRKVKVDSPAVRTNRKPPTRGERMSAAAKRAAESPLRKVIRGAKTVRELGRRSKARSESPRR